jgi:hypothetical protein
MTTRRMVHTSGTMVSLARAIGLISIFLMAIFVVAESILERPLPQFEFAVAYVLIGFVGLALSFWQTLASGAILVIDSLVLGDAIGFIHSYPIVFLWLLGLLPIMLFSAGVLFMLSWWLLRSRIR